MKPFAGAQVAEQMNGRASERIMAAVQARARLIDIYAQLFMVGAMPLQFVPGAGGKRNAVAVVDRAARKLAGERIQAWIVLRPFDLVLGVDLAVAGKEILVVENLVGVRFLDQEQCRQRQQRTGDADRLTENIL